MIAWLTTTVVPIVAFLGVAGPFGPAARGQFDVRVAAVRFVQPVLVAQPGFELDVSTFDQWLYGKPFSDGEARKLFQTELDLWMMEFNRAWQLDDNQQTKLRLAAQGDIHRFLEEVAAAREKFMELRRDQNRINEIFNHIQPLRRRLTGGGFFGPDSLLRKSIASTLDEAQMQSWREVEESRRRFHFEAGVENFVASVGQALALSETQQEQLCKLLWEESEPPIRSGANESYYVMYQLSKIPEDRLRPLFDEPQWKLMQQHIIQGKGMESFLKVQGFLK